MVEANDLTIRNSMFLNVTNIIGCWKGTAMEFISLFLLLWKAPRQGMGSIPITESFSLDLHSGLQDELLKVTCFPSK